MKTLNLTDLDKSNIKYKISKFPDGQQNIVIQDIGLGGNFYDLLDITHDEGHDKVIIKSRLNNWLDLELICCAVASLRELNPELKIHLYTPYIMGARSDRKFEDGGNNYLRDVLSPVINSLNFKTVTCIDPHSDVLEACIKGFKKESNEKFLRIGLDTFLGPLKLHGEEFILVSPDAGASKKIYKLAEQIGYKRDIITCSKDRDLDGKLTKCIVPMKPEYTTKDLIIIDDICDGGATFINIAKEIKAKGLDNKIYLIVTHGIFSAGFEQLSQYFDGIYTTNSYSTIWNGNDAGKLIKQLNVF